MSTTTNARLRELEGFSHAFLSNLAGYYASRLRTVDVLELPPAALDAMNTRYARTPKQILAMEDACRLLELL